MRSTQVILPGESAALFCEKEREIVSALMPADAVQQMLADRVVMRNWYRLRGERATVGRLSEGITEIVEDSVQVAFREVRRLGPLVDSDPEAVFELQTFPEGVTYLIEAWVVLLDRVLNYSELMYTERLRCFSLLGKRPEQVLTGDPVATRWLRAQIGSKLGEEASLEDVADFLGGQPPEWMPQDEFWIRVKEMAGSLHTRQGSIILLKTYIQRVITDLKALHTTLVEAAERKLHAAAEGALVDTSPEGTRLSNYIDKVDRGCDAALRRLEIRQKPKRGESTKSERTVPSAPMTQWVGDEDTPTAGGRWRAEGRGHDRAGRHRRRPDSPVARPRVADDVQVTFAAEVPTVLETIESAEPNREDDPGPSAADPEDAFSTVEAHRTFSAEQPVGGIFDSRSHRRFARAARGRVLDSRSHSPSPEQPADGLRQSKPPRLGPGQPDDGFSTRSNPLTMASRQSKPPPHLGSPALSRNH